MRQCQRFTLILLSITHLHAADRREGISGDRTPRLRAGHDLIIQTPREQFIREIEDRHDEFERLRQSFNAQLVTTPLPYAMEHVPLEIRQNVSGDLINSYFGESTDDPLELAFKFLRLGQGIRNFSGLDRGYSLHLAATCYFAAAARIETIADKISGTSEKPSKPLHDLYYTAAQIFYWASLAKASNPIAVSHIQQRVALNIMKGVFAESMT